MLPHRVAVVALPDVIVFELGIASRLFGVATDAEGRPLYDVRHCSVDGAPVGTSSDLRLVADHGLELLDWADTVVLPGVYGGPEFATGELDPRLRGPLDAAAGRARLMSICTGAFVLAAAGLLDGRSATTHWRHTARFRRQFPNVRLDPDVLFVDDGDRLTSAGTAAGIDLCLHVIRRDHGTEVANRAARLCVVPPWRDGGQSQFVVRHLPERPDTSTGGTREWLLRHLAEPIDLAAMAGHARMSVRTFTRRFRDETGLSPGQWLIQQRVEHARHLLESTRLPIDEVARRAGFGTATSLRQHLRSVLGVAPSDYRQTFSAAH